MSASATRSRVTFGSLTTMLLSGAPAPREPPARCASPAGQRYRYPSAIPRRARRGRIRSSGSCLAHSAVHHQLDAGDETAFDGRQEQRGARPLFRAADPADRDDLGQARPELGPAIAGEVRDTLRIGRPRADRVDPDAAPLHLERSVRASDRTTALLAM